MSIVKAILFGVMGSVGVMVSIPQAEAISNLSTWWVWFGLPPFKALRSPAVDTWVLVGCIVVVVALFVPWKRIFSRPKDSSAYGEGRREDVLRMMNGIYEYVLFYHDLKAGRIEPLPPKKHSKSMIQAGRAALWRRRLADMGLRPPGTNDLFGWQCYLELIIPRVEQDGVDAALKETEGWNEAHRQRELEGPEG